MPDSSLSQAIKEAYASAPADVVVLHTLEFRHPAFTQPLRVVLDHVDHTCTLEADAPVDPSTAVLFIGYAFKLDLPTVDNGAAPEVVITIDNVTLEIEDNIAAALTTTDKVVVTYRPYQSNDLSAPSMNPPMTLTITAINADNYRVTARAQLGDFANKAFPAENYTTSRFPGLVQ
ncbi:MAG: DUF1833 family protein [Methylotenera sp.]|nr:DUF1833 family protein [Methylotenera sp.]